MFLSFFLFEFMPNQNDGERERSEEIIAEIYKQSELRYLIGRLFDIINTDSIQRRCNKNISNAVQTFINIVLCSF